MTERNPEITTNDAVGPMEIVGDEQFVDLLDPAKQQVYTEETDRLVQLPISKQTEESN